MFWAQADSSTITERKRPDFVQEKNFKSTRILVDFMSRIWYSVQGEGLGHAFRSEAVIENLLGKHKILVTACNRTYPYLRKKFGSIVHYIEGDKFAYENNEVSINKTVKEYIRSYPAKIQGNIKKVRNLIRKFNPDVIISDFEPVSHYFGFFLGIPVISLDNINVLAQCRLDVDYKFKFEWWYTKTLINLYHPRSDYYFIPAIFRAIPLRKNTFVFPPVLRKKILDAKPSRKNFILVYQSSSSNEKLVPVLKSINERFIFYGMGKGEKDANVAFKNFSENGFIRDLAGCKAIIVNGGFTAISEALYLKKPILAVPIQNQFEQVFNGMTLKRENFGDWSESPDKKTIMQFLSKIRKYESSIKKATSNWSNNRLLQKLDEKIRELSKTKKRVFKLAAKLDGFIESKTAEKTLTIIKPDAVERRLIGEVIRRFEKEGITPVAMKMNKISPAKARRFYSHLKGKIPQPVFDSIVGYMTSSKVVLIVWQGKNVVGKVRMLCGPTDPKMATKKNIRFLSKDDMNKRFRKGEAVRNIIHSSANDEEAKKEISFFFSPWEMMKM